MLTPWGPPTGRWLRFGTVTLAIIVVAILILFAVTWFGFQMARTITEPIGTLAEATELTGLFIDGPVVQVKDTLGRVRAGEEDPGCLLCGGILKSDTISFGQALVPEVIERAMRISDECDVMLAVGAVGTPVVRTRPSLGWSYSTKKPVAAKCSSSITSSSVLTAIEGTSACFRSSVHSAVVLVAINSEMRP